jgi:hypothetical protein
MLPIIVALLAADPSTHAEPFFAAHARGTLQWSASFEPCVKGKARVRLSLVDAQAVKSSLLLDDIDVSCPMTRVKEDKPLARDSVVLDGKANGPNDDRDRLEIGSIAIASDRRGVVVVYAAGFESVGYDHALYVEEDGAIKRPWRYAHAGFEMGTVEEQFAIEPQQASGSEHLVAAFQHLGTEQPLEHVKLSYDVERKKIAQEPLPYFVVIVASDKTVDDANKRLDEQHKRDCMAMFAFVGDSTGIHGLQPGLVVTAFPAPTKERATALLAEVKQKGCWPDAYVKEVR